MGTTVIQVSATDADHGKNAEVHYYLAPEKDYTKFQIHKDSGLLTTREVLDREQQAVYEVSRSRIQSLTTVKYWDNMHVDRGRLGKIGYEVIFFYSKLINNSFSLSKYLYCHLGSK